MRRDTVEAVGPPSHGRAAEARLKLRGLDTASTRTAPRDERANGVLEDEQIEFTMRRAADGGLDQRRFLSKEGLVAFTGHALEAGPIQYLDYAARIRNDTVLLYLDCDFCH